VAIHDFRMVSGEERVNLIFDMEVPYEYDEIETEAEDIYFDWMYNDEKI